VAYKCIKIQKKQKKQKKQKEEAEKAEEEEEAKAEAEVTNLSTTVAEAVLANKSTDDKVEEAL
jgi:hypothetical protein